MSDEIDALKRRRDAAWKDKTLWNAIYAEAWRYAVPYRKPANGPQGQDKGASRVDHLYDITAIVSGFRGAGRLQQDLFPPGRKFFRIVPGPVTRAVLQAVAAERGIGDNGGPPLADQGPPARDGAWYQRQFDNVTAQLAPFFQSGEWDNAISEMCIDLFVGTGIMLLIEGDRERPIRFVTLPVDECAIEMGAYGDVSGLYWKVKMTRRAIAEAFPKGRFPSAWADELKNAPDDEVDLHQDFVRAGKGWKLVVTLADSDDPIITQRYKTQPFVCARYFRVPGESHGRGPILLAVPTIRTVNRAMELSLKNFALAMLGLWLYRPGGTFNPDTAPKSPGSFWPVQSTGGVMGPDVSRLDTGGGQSAQMAQIVIAELRGQIQQALHDEQLPADGATPKSATEIMARVERIKQNYVGAFGRMIYEVIPVVVRRAAEILYRLGLMTVEIKVDELLTSIDVTSPLAIALKAESWRTTLEAMQTVAALEGPEAVRRYFKTDELIPQMIIDLGVDSNMVRNAAELAAYDKAEMQQMQAAALAQAATQDPQKFTGALSDLAGMGQQQAGAAA